MVDESRGYVCGASAEKDRFVFPKYDYNDNVRCARELVYGGRVAHMPLTSTSSRGHGKIESTTNYFSSHKCTQWKTSAGFTTPLFECAICSAFCACCDFVLFSLAHPCVSLVLYFSRTLLLASGSATGPWP